MTRATDDNVDEGGGCRVQRRRTLLDSSGSPEVEEASGAGGPATGDVLKNII